jgi:hypothetical protein
MLKMIAPIAKKAGKMIAPLAKEAAVEFAKDPYNVEKLKNMFGRNKKQPMQTSGIGIAEGNKQQPMQTSGIVIAEGNKQQPMQTSDIDIAKELRKYKGLLDEDIITQEEFDVLKKQILGF